MSQTKNPKKFDKLLGDIKTQILTETNNFKKKKESVLIFPIIFFDKILDLVIEYVPLRKFLSVSIGQNDECVIRGTQELSKIKKPWGNYDRLTMNIKKPGITGNYGFSIQCEGYAGSNLTHLLVYIFFYVLKLKAKVLNTKSPIITDWDESQFSPGKSIAEKVVENLKITDIGKIMKTPLLYYERFGFVYPEKREYFKNYLKSGKAYVEDFQLKNKKLHIRQTYISRMYMDLNKLSMKRIKDKINCITFKQPRVYKN